MLVLVATVALAAPALTGVKLMVKLPNQASTVELPTIELPTIKLPTIPGSDVTLDDVMGHNGVKYTLTKPWDVGIGDDGPCGRSSGSFVL